MKFTVMGNKKSATKENKISSETGIFYRYGTLCEVEHYEIKKNQLTCKGQHEG